MPEDLIESLWERGQDRRPLGREELASALRPRLERGTRRLRVHLWMFLGILLATLVLGGVNIALYWDVPAMRTAQLALTALVLGLALYAIRMLTDPGLADRPTDPLLESVRRRLAFLGPRFEAWMWTASLSVALLAFAVSSVVDSDIGFRINKPAVFVGVNVAMLAICYASLKLSFLPIVRELRATLQDLEDQLLERTADVDRWKQGLRRWHVALVVLLVVLMLLGAWLAWQTST
jgi:hypothetical protein